VQLEMGLSKALCLLLLTCTVASKIPVMPAFLWSPQDTFRTTPNFQVLETVSFAQLKGSVSALYGGDSSPFVGKEATSVVLIAVYPQLSRSLIGSNPASFSNLKNLMTTSASSMTFQYVNTDEVPRDLAGLVGDNGVQEVGDDKAFQQLRVSLMDGSFGAQNKLTTIVLRLPVDLNDANEVFGSVVDALRVSNTPYVGVCVGSPFSNIVQDFPSGNSADVGGRHLLQTAFPLNFVMVYWTPGTWEGLLAAAVILLIIYCGLACTLDIKTATDFDLAEKKTT